MQFQVPQFIETESKIIGPLTLKQFLYIAVAFLFSFFTFFVFKTFAWVILTAVIGIIAFSLAFIKYNGRPLTVLLKSVLAYAWQPKLYLWHQETIALPKIPEIKFPPTGGPEMPTSKIKNLWVNLITKKPSVGAGATAINPPAPIARPLSEGKAGGGGPQVLRDIIKKKDER